MLAEIRRDQPLARAEVPGYDPHWVVTRHADIQEVSRQNDLFHNVDRSATVIPPMGETLVQQFTAGDFNRSLRLRFDRARNRHVGFGYGGHVCLGQHLARLEMCTLWEQLLPALAAVEMTGPGQLIASEFVSGPKSVPIRYRLV